MKEKITETYYNQLYSSDIKNMEKNLDKFIKHKETEYNKSKNKS